VFGPDGKVFLTGINFPGSWHDSAITQNFFSFIKTNIKDYRICVDQGFPRSGQAYDMFVGTVSQRQADK